MKNILFIILVFISAALYGQANITVHDFLPQIFYTRQSLIDHYQDQKLNYDAFIKDLENRSGDGMTIISSDSSQITYIQIHRGSPDTITYILTFNTDRQLIKWETDYKDCYDRYSGSDVPEPFISNMDISYNRFGQIVQKSGYCATSEFSIRTNYYYNQKNELDSITFREGYMNPDPYQKIIFVDTSIRSGESNSTMAFILNTRFDYIEWLKNELTGIQSEQRSPLNSSIINRSRNEEKINYVYEFDSLGRITSLLTLDVYAELSPSLFAHGCDNCEEKCELPSVLEFYYEKDKIIGVDCISFSKTGADHSCICWCLIRPTYRKEKIKEINFYTSEDYSWRFVKKWTKRKGFQDVNANSR